MMGSMSLDMKEKAGCAQLASFLMWSQCGPPMLNRLEVMFHFTHSIAIEAPLKSLPYLNPHPMQIITLTPLPFGGYTGKIIVDGTLYAGTFAGVAQYGNITINWNAYKP